MVLAITLLACAGLFVERRRQAADPRANIAAAAGVVVLLALARVVLRIATTRIEPVRSLVSPLDLLLTALVASALVWLALDLVESRPRLRSRTRQLPAEASVGAAVVYLAAGALDAALVWAYGRFLESVVSRTSVDLLHFSLHPFNASRLSLAFALVLLHAAVIWTAVAIIRLPTLWWRMPRGKLPAIAATSWMVGAFAVIAIIGTRDPSMSLLPLVAALAAVTVCALSLPRIRARARRESQFMRLTGLFLALLVPALAMYPSLSASALQAKERLIASDYGSQVATMRDDLQRRLLRALEQIDARPPETLAQLLAPPADEEMTNRAFVVWSQTDLETHRVTSAVELYGRDGRRLSRFALILPQNTATPYLPAECTWSLSDDVSPPLSSRTGANESHVLRASRGVCVNGRPMGGIIVRAMLDYRTLPFIASRSPYLESLQPDLAAPGKPYRDVTWNSCSTDGAVHRSSRPARGCGRCPTRRSSARPSRGRRSGRVSIAAPRRFGCIS